MNNQKLTTLIQRYASHRALLADAQIDNNGLEDMWQVEVCKDTITFMEVHGIELDNLALCRNFLKNSTYALRHAA